MSMKTARILAFAGSARTGSFNKKLLRVAADGDVLVLGVAGQWQA